MGNAVDQRLFPIVIQHFPSIAVDAVNKEVGIERRFGNKSQNCTVLRIDGHQCATAVAQNAVGFLLHTDIHAQAQGLPHFRRNIFQYADDVAVSVFFDFLIAWNAMKLVFVIFFQAGLADMRTAAVEGGQAFFFQHFFVFIANTADIA